MDLEGVLEILVLMVHLVSLVHIDVVVLELYFQLVHLALSDPPEVIELPVLHSLHLFHLSLQIFVPTLQGHLGHLQVIYLHPVLLYIVLV